LNDFIAYKLGMSTLNWKECKVCYT